MAKLFLMSYTLTATTKGGEAIICSDELADGTWSLTSSVNGNRSVVRGLTSKCAIESFDRAGAIVAKSTLDPAKTISSALAHFQDGYVIGLTNGGVCVEGIAGNRTYTQDVSIPEWSAKIQKRINFINKCGPVEVDVYTPALLLN